MVVGRAVALSDKPGDKPMTTADRLALGRERAIEGRSLADLHREAVKLAVDIERERCAKIADQEYTDANNMSIKCEGQPNILFSASALSAAHIARLIRKDPAQRA